MAKGGGADLWGRLCRAIDARNPRQFVDRRMGTAILTRPEVSDVVREAHSPAPRARFSE